MKGDISNQYTFTNLLSMGSLVALAGFILSGPAAFLIVRIVHPQPTWVSSSVFVENYHFIQDLPYYFGFLLIGGMLMVSVGHYLSETGKSEPTKSFHLLFALGWNIVFCTLISFNYISQISFVRNLALNYKQEHDAAIAAFSMANRCPFVGPMKCGDMDS